MWQWSAPLLNPPVFHLVWASYLLGFLRPIPLILFTDLPFFKTLRFRIALAGPKGRVFLTSARFFRLLNVFFITFF